MMMKRMQETLRTVMTLLSSALSLAPYSSAAVHSRQISSAAGDT